jgi:DNA-binding CsgD family transcriptional regulator
MDMHTSALYVKAPSSRGWEVQQSMRSAAIADPDSFLHWSRTWLNERIPHHMSAFGLTTKHTLGVKPLETFTFRVPEAYLQQVTHNPGVGCPVFSHWILARTPQFFCPDMAGENVALASLFKQYALGNLFLHGHVDADRGLASYFALFGVDMARRAHHEHHAEAVARGVHEALVKIHHVRANGNPAGAAVRSLTKAEQAVFHWLRQGKTNWEIAHILNKSEWTVKTQVQHILRKLDARNRQVAISRQEAVS